MENERMYVWMDGWNVTLNIELENSVRKRTNVYLKSVGLLLVIAEDWQCTLQRRILGSLGTRIYIIRRKISIRYVELPVYLKESHIPAGKVLCRSVSARAGNRSDVGGVTPFYT